MTPTTSKILPIALVAALLGGTAGAFISRSSRNTAPADQPVATSPVATLGASEQPAESSATNAAPASDLTVSSAANGQSAYRDGFTDGLKAASEQNQSSSSQVASTDSPKSNSSTRTVSHNTSRRSVNTSTSRRAYYDYNQPQPKPRSFWDKHRDKLTVAMGGGGGALLGGLIGGKRGAGIGAIAGGAGSALYTYKIRKKNRRY